MQTIRLKGSISEDGQLILPEQSLALPAGEVDVIVLPSKTATEQQSAPYTPQQKAIVEKFLNMAGIVNSNEVDSSVKVDEVVYGDNS